MIGLSGFVAVGFFSAAHHKPITFASTSSWVDSVKKANFKVRKQRIVDEIHHIESTASPCTWYSLDPTVPSVSDDSLDTEMHKLRQTPCSKK